MCDDGGGMLVGCGARCVSVAVVVVEVVVTEVVMGSLGVGFSVAVLDSPYAILCIGLLFVTRRLGCSMRKDRPK